MGRSSPGGPSWPLVTVRARRAWRITRGAGAVVAVIDDAVDTRHPEFEGRVLDGWAAEPEAGPLSNRRWLPHGTKCAGMALAGGIEVSGVAPEALLLPVSIPSLAHRIGDASEARAIRWAAASGADVICCAWGPPAPTLETGRLPSHTRQAIDWATKHGRGGKGCVIVFAAGNDGADVGWNGYASHPAVIAVGACDSQGKRRCYSNWGDALWCVFPSGDPARAHAADGLVLTTTPVGSFLKGETFYAFTAGHTSTAAAGIAGLCALMLSANPNLTWWEVKDILRRSGVKVDRECGGYDPRGHSAWYGYGRPDAARAVRLASEPRNPRHPSV